MFCFSGDLLMHGTADMEVERDANA